MEYYNDLPGKTPPEFSPVQKSMPRPENRITDSNRMPRDSCGSNLIDFHSDLSKNDPEYVNGDVPNPRKQSHRDVFDMSKSAPCLHFCLQCLQFSMKI